MKRIAIIQSSYIPWKGYFDIIHDVDEFIFLDDVQFTTRDWRTRNRIKTIDGLLWLSVPAGGHRNRKICEVELHDHAWQSKHWKSIVHAYGNAPHFSRYRAFFEDIYLGTRWAALSGMNQAVTKRIAHEILDIHTRFTDSREYVTQGVRTAKLIDLVATAGGTHYLSGPAARDYIETEAFESSGIDLEYKDYAGYPEYPQSHPPFEHAVSILDLIFHTGPEAPDYIWGHRLRSAA